MKISILQLNKLVAATVTGLGIALTIAPSASLAQSSQDAQDSYIPPSSIYGNDTLDTKQGDGNSIYGPENGNFNPLNLIHQANFGTLDFGEFSSQNRENLKNEVGSFRAKQQRLLQQRQQGETNGQNPQQQGGFNFLVPVYTPAQTTPASGN